MLLKYLRSVQITVIYRNSRVLDRFCSSHANIMKRAAESTLFNVKKPKTEIPSTSSASSSTSSAKDQSELRDVIKERRKKTAESVLDFKFNKKRVRILSKEANVKEKCDSVCYWMSRDQRVQDNWAFLMAQKLALKNDVALKVVFCLVPSFLDCPVRHFDFLINGLKEVAEECKKLSIEFYLLMGKHSEEIHKFVKDHSVGAVVCDFSPLRVPAKWVDEVKDNLPKDIPLVQVDAHNIVPVWVASDKQEYAARTIRNKINNNLPTYLTEFPAVIKHPYKSKDKAPEIDWKAAFASLKVDNSIGPVDWAKPGYKAGIQTLESFINVRLKKFNDKRNDPTINALSNLSPWFHFGQISVQRAILEVQKYKSKCSESVAGFCEEAIVRRELSDNFCFYNKNYDNLNGLADWAKKTLDDHRKDKRVYLYTQDELADSKTHDDLWNSAQIQLVKEGKMHGFLRMYWAKKILEWTESPDEALRIAIYLNDRYSLDGRDPNGYVGCMWSIGGIHDQGWKERDVFGKIRYMNYEGCKRKFDIKAFIARYGGKCHIKKQTSIKKFI